MSRHKNALDHKGKVKRQKARVKIIEAAQRGRVSQGHFTMRHLQRCVAIVRKRRLVKSDVLVTAGFRGYDS